MKQTLICAAKLFMARLTAALLVAAALFGLAPARADAVTLSIRAQKPTSVNLVAYRLGGVTVTTPGALATTAVTLSVPLSPGTHTLSTSFGPMVFDLASDGTITPRPGFPFTASGSDITILNSVNLGTLTVVARNATSFNAVSYELKDFEESASAIGAAQTVAGSPATPVTFPFEGMAPNMDFLLSTTLGFIHFRLDASGALMHGNSTIPGSQVPAELFSIADSTITIENTVGFTTLTVNAERPTSVNTFGARIRSWSGPVAQDIGPSGLVPGSQATTGVTLPFAGMARHMNFILNTTVGGMHLALDATGNVTFGFSSLPGAGSDLLFSASGPTITVKNRVSFPGGLTVKAAKPTSLANVSFQLISHEGAIDPRPEVGPIQTVSGADATTGVIFPFEGMLPTHHFQLGSDFGSPFFGLDENGNLVTSPLGYLPQNQLALSLSGSTITFQNTFDLRLKVTADHDATTVSNVMYRLQSLYSHPSGPEQTLPASDVAEGTDLPMLGMAPFQRLRFVASPFGSFFFLLLPEATARFEAGAVNLTPTKGAFPIEGGTNTLFVEIMSANQAPVVDAGENIMIATAEQATTVLVGTATDPDGDALACRWLAGVTQVSAPAPPVQDRCELALGSLAPLSIGEYMFTLEVSDGIATVTDNIVVTVANSPPDAAPSGAGTYQVGDVVFLGGTVSDFDGDTLRVTWRRGGLVLSSFEGVQTVAGGSPVPIPTSTLSTLGLDPGSHTLDLAVSDGVNAEVVRAITVVVIDTTAPTVAPVATPTILWPPNHQMVDVIVDVRAADNSGERPSLSVEITSSEPSEFDGDGNFLPDHEVVEVDSAAGLVRLRLRAERSGRGDGRAYAIRITATDPSGNSSTAEVLVVAPHNRRR